MQNVVQSAQALQGCGADRAGGFFSCTLDMGTMVYILVDADSRIRFANHTVWRDSNAIPESLMVMMLLVIVLWFRLSCHKFSFNL